MSLLTSYQFSWIFFGWKYVQFVAYFVPWSHINRIVGGKETLHSAARKSISHARCSQITII